MTKKGAGMLSSLDRRNLFIKTIEIDTMKYEATTRAILIFSPSIGTVPKDYLPVRSDRYERLVRETDWMHRITMD